MLDEPPLSVRMAAGAGVMAPRADRLGGLPALAQDRGGGDERPLPRAANDEGLASPDLEPHPGRDPQGRVAAVEREDPLDVVARLGKGRDAAVLLDRPRTGVVGRERALDPAGE